MSVKAVTYFEVSCDAPDCKLKTADLFSEYSAWADAGQALDEWLDADGTEADGKTFCYEHSAKDEEGTE